MPLTGYSLTVACLALNIYHEGATSNEPTPCLEAIARVTINRTHLADQDTCDTVFASRQFSWANHARDERGKLLPAYLPRNKPVWRKSLAIAKRVPENPTPDNTKGATHFHASYIRKPVWAKKLKPTLTCGKHIFYRR